MMKFPGPEPGRIPGINGGWNPYPMGWDGTKLDPFWPTYMC